MRTGSSCPQRAGAVVGAKWVLAPIPAGAGVGEGGGRPTKEPTMHETLITPAGLARLEAELDRLRTDGRRDAAEQLREAATAGADLAESPEYHAAREHKALLEARIAQLEDRL